MFELHPRLRADTFHLADWSLCRLLLMNDARYPWLILVPRIPGAVELHDLGEEQAEVLVQEVRRASRALARWSGADKINIGALGNLVPQLHVHVLARFRTDAAWPGPVWGQGVAEPYGEEAAHAILAALHRALETA